MNKTDILLFLMIAFAASWLFYDSVIPAFAMLPLFIPFEKYLRSVRKKKRDEEMTAQFISAAGSVSTSLFAGLSVENAFVFAASDMERLYGKGSYIVKELDTLNSKTEAGQRLTEALFELAKRWRIQEIYDLSVVFSSAVKNGGNLPTVISSCTQLMEKRLQAQEEARCVIREKQYEQKVMCIIPPGILLYLRFSSGSFISVLYHNAFGITVMTICLAVYIAAICMSERIGDIRV